MPGQTGYLAMAEKRLYKIIFLNHGKVYELYSEGVTSSGLWGFIEVSELVFDSAEGLVVDPTEEKMRQEFEGASDFEREVAALFVDAELFDDLPDLVGLQLAQAADRETRSYRRHQELAERVVARDGSAAAADAALEEVQHAKPRFGRT